MARRAPARALPFHADLQLGLNQVELWFAKIERDLIARGIFTSVPDLRKKLLQYITLHNKTAQPFEWTYTNPKHRLRAIRNSDARH